MIASARISDRFDPRANGEADQLAAALNENLSGTGPAVVRYEAALAKKFGVDEAITASSGSSAVMVALAALGLEPGDEVILTPTCPLCTVYPILALRLVPVFCDTRKDSFSLDLAMAKRLVSKKTRVIMDIPMWGYPIAADETAAFAADHHLPFVLDLAHGHGIKLKDKWLWDYADVATFSTHSSKIMVTGEGGYILTNQPDVAEKAKLYARFGNLDGVHFGMNHKLGGLQAALGLTRLQRLFDDIDTRRQTMASISARLDNPRLEALPILPGGAPNGLSLLVRELSGRGAALISYLDSYGIPSDISRYDCKPLYKFPILSKYGRECPNAERLLASLTTIPLHPDLSNAEVDRIIAALASYPGAANA